MDKEEYIHQYATQLFNDRIRDLGNKENIHFSIDDIIKVMWTSWDASYFYQWKSVQASLPPKGQCVNVMMEDGRYTNSFIMSDGTWAYNVRPIAWSEIKRPILYHKPMIELKYPGMKTKKHYLHRTNRRFIQRENTSYSFRISYSADKVQGTRERRFLQQADDNYQP